MTSGASALLVFIGAGIGGVVRHGVNLWAIRLGPAFPWATFSVNVVGSFLMGVVMALVLRHGGSEAARLFFATGVLGGFTTFSAFTNDLIGLLMRGALTTALLYVVGSVLLSVVATYAGFAMFGVKPGT
jgi:fluoride exporter